MKTLAICLISLISAATLAWDTSTAPTFGNQPGVVVIPSAPNTVYSSTWVTPQYGTGGYNWTTVTPGGGVDYGTATPLYGTGGFTVNQFSLGD